MKVLGIDPGSRKLGWAVVEVVGKKFKYIDSGVLRFDKIEELMDRLPVISKSLKELISIHAPNEIALESLIYVKNVTSLAKLAQARGAAIAGVSEKYQGKIFEYAPNKIKSTVAGHGHANKESLDKVLKMMFGDIKFTTNDESDALAIAICHGMNIGQSILNTGKKHYSKGRSLKDVFKKVK
ncbi:crossover junction endodeoxyribonuclease RuvC [Bacteriovorax sp. Seq25_V]|uniref:crossover junction endodeoxyribonuclease RuvC n=1 Tax=Bacteriovorax sp. Seq25_V TaxID=1201288 RepID=UPI00038A0D54|nr:crossover junction endodeoxyribonuclease RuvC [Bacteriovorax sp. Seq25_V]EQC43567.1 crossover junction endodeoxyribonuclease RuvC [Bacteriovorax sp. Seq25_V]